MVGHPFPFSFFEFVSLVSSSIMPLFPAIYVCICHLFVKDHVHTQNKNQFSMT